MTCSYFRSLLDDLLDRELSPSTETTVRNHLSVCESCRSEYENLARLRQLLSGLAVPEPPSEYWPESIELIRARTIENSPAIGLPDLLDQRAQERASFYRSLVAVAASLIVFFGSLLIGTSESPLGGPHAVIPSTITPITTNLTESTARRTNYISADEQTLIAGSMLLVGTPGMLASSSSLAIALSSDRTR